MNVEHFMTKNPVTCEFEDSVQHAAELMRDKNVGSVIVLRDGKVAGMVTDRQIVTEAAANGDLEGPVSRIMAENPARLTLEDNLFSCIDSFRSAGMVRRLPVVNASNELLGVVSLSDIAVIAKDLVDHILRDETHHSLREAHFLTGGKEMVKRIRRPTKLERLSEGTDVRVTRRGTQKGPPMAHGGMPGRPPRQRTKSARSIGTVREEGARFTRQPQHGARATKQGARRRQVRRTKSSRRAPGPKQVRTSRGKAKARSASS